MMVPEMNSKSHHPNETTKGKGKNDNTNANDNDNQQFNSSLRAHETLKKAIAQERIEV